MEREGRNFSSFGENGLAGLGYFWLDRRGAVEKFGPCQVVFGKSRLPRSLTANMGKICAIVAGASGQFHAVQERHNSIATGLN